MMGLDNGWYCLTTGAYKKYRLRKIYGVWFLTDAIWALEYTEYSINVLKPDVMKMMYLINIQYNIIIIDCTKGWHWKLSPLENHCYPQVQALFIYHNTFINRLLVRHQVIQSDKDVKIPVLRVQ